MFTNFFGQEAEEREPSRSGWHFLACLSCRTYDDLCLAEKNADDISFRRLSSESDRRSLVSDMLDEEDLGDVAPTARDNVGLTGGSVVLYARLQEVIH